MSIKERLQNNLKGLIREDKIYEVNSLFEGHPGYVTVKCDNKLIVHKTIDQLQKGGFYNFNLEGNKIYFINDENYL